jgi:hypothetical protein
VNHAGSEVHHSTGRYPGGPIIVANDNRLQSGMRLNAQPTTTRDIDELRKQQRSRL